jgi:outer membrane protein OmpA-like peptidoglycan-associated protein
MKRSCRLSSPSTTSARRSLAALLVGGIVLSASAASAGVEIGVTGGLHVFNDDNELGVADEPEAPSLANSALFGLRLGFTFGSIVGIEGEVGYIPTEPRDRVLDIQALTYRGHLILQFRKWNPENRFIPFILGGAGAFQVLDSEDTSVIDEDIDEVGYAGIGAKILLDGGWGIRVDGRTLFPPSSRDDFATVDFEALLSIYKEFGREPKKEAPPPPPPAPLDADGDGLNDDVDQCPQEAEDKDGFEDENGCPDNDNDADGVADGADKCPTEAEDKDAFQDEDGCPDADNDADGLVDGTDKCPLEAEDKDSFQDEDGCPDLDNDGDGVPDANDKCIDTLETKNGYQDSDGCPDEIPAQVKRFTGVIKGITFKTKSAEILKPSFKTIDGAVKVLQEYTELKLEIQGHTDDVGDDAFNLDLSQQRAESVKAYFVSKGIDEGRITAKGYGETNPVDPRKTKAARAKNRRVEFKLVSDLVIETAPGQPTPAVPSAPNPAPEAAPTPAPGAPAPQEAPKTP